MAIGPGKYDGWCTRVREGTGAQGAILIVFMGEQGSGFSCQGPPSMLASVPEILENIARQIREGKAPL